MTDTSTTIVNDDRIGKPLPPWTYTNPELFRLEYDAFFLSRWQWICHTSDLQQAGDYVATEIGLDSVFVIKSKDGALRAFQNVCRHRASRILQGRGQCRGVICCPYHGWTYGLDGALKVVPQQDSFRDLDKTKFGLKEIYLEVFFGLVFVCIKDPGITVANMFAHTDRYFEQYGVQDYQQCAENSSEIWDVNWKVAWDNYLENYHLPMGHPGLNRLVTTNDEYECLSSGIDYGTFVVNSKPSRMVEEREYQTLFAKTQTRVPTNLKGKWVQFGVEGGLGIDLYPEMVDMFQLIPLGPEKTLVRAAYYGHKDPTPDEQALRQLNLKLNNKVNDEDRVLCTRVQLGLKSHHYQPGPLSDEEIGLFRFHESVRKKVPVTTLSCEPARGSVSKENQRLLTMGPNSLQTT